MADNQQSSDDLRIDDYEDILNGSSMRQALRGILPPITLSRMTMNRTTRRNIVSDNGLKTRLLLLPYKFITASLTDGPIDGPTDLQTDGRTHALIEMRGRI